MAGCCFVSIRWRNSVANLVMAWASRQVGRLRRAIGRRRVAQATQRNSKVGRNHCEPARHSSRRTLLGDSMLSHNPAGSRLSIRSSRRSSCRSSRTFLSWTHYRGGTTAKTLFVACCVTVAIACMPLAAEAATLVGWWPFEGTNADDVTGNFASTTLFGAAVANGRLSVSASLDTYARSGTYSGPTLTEKTLVTWVYLDSLADRGGSALTIEKQTDNVFDAVVYAERESFKWMSGSNVFARTEDPPQQGTAEGSSSSTVIKMAIVYKADNSITIYRNDVLYSAYTKGALQTYPGGSDTNVMFGRRHGTADPGNRALTGRIEEARVYDGALTASEIAALTPIDCDDGDPCTLDDYDSLASSCTHDAPSCTCSSGTCAPVPPNMVSWYPMEGSVADRLGTNNPSASANVSFVAGKVGQAVSPDAGGYIDVADSPSLQLQQISIAAWVRPDGPGPNLDGSIIVVKNSNANDVSVGMGWNPQTNGLGFVVGTTGAGADNV